MKSNFSGELLIKPARLFIAWYLLQEDKKRSSRKFYNGRNSSFFKPSIHPLIGRVLKDYQHLRYILLHLVEQGCVKELYVYRSEYSESEDTYIDTKTDYINKKTVLDNTNNLFYSLDKDLLSRSADFILSHELKIDGKKTQAYIDSYLDNWKNDKLISMESNVLLARKQTKKVLDIILGLSEEHSPNMMLIEWLDDGDSIDFLATLLYLESLSYIDVVDTQTVTKENFIGEKEGVLSLRINVNDKFFDDLVIETGSYKHIDAECLFDNEAINKPTNSDDDLTVEFDKMGKIFLVEGQKIDVSRTRHQLDFLEIVFEEKPIEEDIDFYEIGEKIDREITSKSAKKRYYQAAYSLNKKIELATGKKLFFKTTRNLVRFNPCYKFNLT